MELDFGVLIAPASSGLGMSGEVPQARVFELALLLEGWPESPCPLRPCVPCVPASLSPCCFVSLSVGMRVACSACACARTYTQSTRCFQKAGSPHPTPRLIQGQACNVAAFCISKALVPNKLRSLGTVPQRQKRSTGKAPVHNKLWVLGGNIAAGISRDTKLSKATAPIRRRCSLYARVSIWLLTLKRSRLTDRKKGLRWIS